MAGQLLRATALLTRRSDSLRWGARCVPASGQSSPGMIHSISSADNASRPCLSWPIAANKSFTIWTFSCVLIEISPFPLYRFVSDWTHPCLPTLDSAEVYFLLCVWFFYLLARIKIPCLRL